jgi:hypothetical protein
VRGIPETIPLTQYTQRQNKNIDIKVSVYGTFQEYPSPSILKDKIKTILGEGYS